MKKDTLTTRKDMVGIAVGILERKNSTEHANESLKTLQQRKAVTPYTVEDVCKVATQLYEFVQRDG